MPGIEFVGADPGSDADEDVLDTGPRRPWPRWVWVVAAVLVVAVAVGIVVSSRSDDHPTARATPTTTSAAPSVEPSFDPGPVQQIVALTSDGTSLFWVAGNRLFRAGPVGRASASVAISPTGGDFAELQLVPDPAEKTIWVVSHGSADSNGGAGNVEGFATTDLTRVVRASAQSLIGGAAAYNGALFVLASGRLLRITSHASGFTPIVAVDPHAHDLVALGDSLYYVEGGNSSAVGRWTPSAGVRRPVVLDTTDSSLAVVGSTVFVVGTRRGTDVLDTLKPVGAGGGVDVRGIATGLTGDLQVVATGNQVLLVLGGGTSGLQLSCVYSNTRVAASTPEAVAVAPAVSANVAVLQGEVFQAVGGSVRPVSFGDNVCPG